jgi:hypothetical protein
MSMIGQTMTPGQPCRNPPIVVEIGSARPIDYPENARSVPRSRG